MKVQKAGFQNQEDGVLLVEGGNASVHVWYTRTGLPKFASYSMSNMLREHTHRYQSPLFELPYLRWRVKLATCPCPTDSQHRSHRTHHNEHLLHQNAFHIQVF